MKVEVGRRFRKSSSTQRSERLPAKPCHPAQQFPAAKLRLRKEAPKQRSGVSAGCMHAFWRHRCLVPSSLP
eukprot:8095360-Prorocentrum_lima.AAC.1